jgi:HSP20 family molecular chaperone IbpA
MTSRKTTRERKPDVTVLLNLHSPATLAWEMQQVQLGIARRAYELFENRGCEHGHDWEDWFRAESELLRPVPISMSETNERISVRVNVLGFEEKELRVAVEPARIMILGRKEFTTTQSEGGKMEYIDWYPDQILRLIDLPVEVVPEGAVVELQGGLLQCELPKAGPKGEMVAVAA